MNVKTSTSDKMIDAILRNRGFWDCDREIILSDSHLNYTLTKIEQAVDAAWERNNY